MELYKWYKGTELPNSECDCVVMYKVTSHNVFSKYAITAQYKIVGQIFLDKPSTGEFGFCDCNNSVIPRSWIISYMPIEFPKEVK